MIKCILLISKGVALMVNQMVWGHQHRLPYPIKTDPSRDGNGPGRPRAGPENPGPRASRAQTGLKIFYLKVLCATENSNFC